MTPMQIGIAAVVIIVIAIAGYIYKYHGFCWSGSCPPNHHCKYKICMPNSSEVYFLKTGVIDAKSAATAAAKYGGAVASMAQLQAAYMAGAQWCIAGWTSDKGALVPAYPMAKAGDGGCGGPGVVAGATLNPLGVNVFGPKPAQGTADVLAFNATKW